MDKVKTVVFKDTLIQPLLRAPETFLSLVTCLRSCRKEVRILKSFPCEELAKMAAKNGLVIIESFAPKLGMYEEGGKGIVYVGDSVEDIAIKQQQIPDMHCILVSSDAKLALHKLKTQIRVLNSMEELATYTEISTSFCTEPALLKTTEQIQSVTRNLSDIANQSLNTALNLLHSVDISGLEALLHESSDNVQHLATICQKAVSEGRRIVILGAGISGRLALSLRKIVLSSYPLSKIEAAIVGGDCAFPLPGSDAYADAQSQLKHIGWNPNSKDLIIGVSVSGNSRTVMDALEICAKEAKGKSVVLYVTANQCSQLNEKFGKEGIDFVGLRTVPMAIAGSTRMQGATSVMLGVGFGVLSGISGDAGNSKTAFAEFIKSVISARKSIDYSGFDKLIKAEARRYQSRENVVYQTDPSDAMLVLSDLVECSSTFGLPPLNSPRTVRHATLCVTSCKTNDEAWEKILGRKPKCLAPTQLSDFDIVTLNPKDCLHHISTEDTASQFELKLSLGEISKSFVWAKTRQFPALSSYALTRMLLCDKSSLICVLQGLCTGNFPTQFSTNPNAIRRSLCYFNDYLANLRWEKYNLPCSLRTYVALRQTEIRKIFISKILSPDSHASLYKDCLDSVILEINRVSERRCLMSQQLIHVARRSKNSPCFWDRQRTSETLSQIAKDRLLLVGVDGGGNKCRISIETLSGNLLGGCCVKKPSHISFGDKTWDNIIEGMVNILSAYQIPLESKEIRFSGCFGLAGSSVPEYVNRFMQNRHVRLFSSLIVTKDSEIAQVAAHNMGNGGIIIIGTGSAAYARFNDSVYTSGGRGFPLSDGGSGAYIGLKAAKALVKSFDGEAPWSPLTKDLTSVFSVVSQLVEWAKKANPTDFSKLAPYVVKHVREDEAAMRIARKAAGKVEELYECTVKKIGRPEARKIPFSLLGGLADTIKQFLPKVMLQVVVSPIYSPAKGAVLLARKEYLKSKKGI